MITLAALLSNRTQAIIAATMIMLHKIPLKNVCHHGIVTLSIPIWIKWFVVNDDMNQLPSWEANNPVKKIKVAKQMVPK